VSSGDGGKRGVGRSPVRHAAMKSRWAEACYGSLRNHGERGGER